MKKFKNDNEVLEFFSKYTLKFHFISDGTIFFKTLVPYFTNDDLVEFQVSFYFNDINELFCYERLEDLIHKFQISQVTSISCNDLSQNELFFREYVDYRDN